MTRMLLLLATTILAAGCASTPTSDPRSASARNAESSVRDGLDYAYIERMNRIAERRGFVIRWVHPPQYRDGKRAEGGAATHGATRDGDPR